AGIAAMAGSALIAFIVIAIISLLVFAYLGAGLYRAAIQQAKGEAISVGHLFSAGDSFTGVLGLMILYIVAGIVLGGALFTLAFVSEELSILLSLFARLLQLVAAGFLFYCIPLIVDRKLGVMDAIRTSISTTRPQWWMYVLFVLVLTIIYIVGVIPCGLGLVVTIPLVFLASAAAYRDTFLQQGGQHYQPFSSPPPPSYYAPQPQFSNPSQPQFQTPPQPQFSEPTPLHSQETQMIGKNCPNCGAALTRVANFCNQCGSSLQ
ncbi:MAG: zinc-ribbon domain-containing protein, partial [Blastocatellia bacterium]